MDFILEMKKKNVESVIPSYDESFKDKSYQLGIQLLEENEFEKAYEALMEAHTRHPEKLQPLYALAKIAGMTDDSETILQIADRIIEIAPDDIQVNFCRGWFLQFVGKYEDAKIALERTLELEPHHRKAKEFLDIVNDQLKTKSADKAIPNQLGASAKANDNLDDPKEVKVITAQEFRLIDENGALRARLGIDKDGSPSLQFINKKGKSPITLGLLQDKSPCLWFYDENDRPYVKLRLVNDNMPNLEFLDKNGYERIALSVDNIDGSPSLDFKDTNFRDRLRIRLYEGKPIVQLTDKNGKELIEVGVYEDEGEYPTLGFRDKNGKLRANICLDDGKPIIDFRDRNGNGRLMITLEDNEESSIYLMDKDMNIIWSAP
ncbi:MAG: hypothetical protein ILNGONEN_01794 [Syntrophorhabdaceae bacterium]|nr:hypothetical protein [Syntrophorhabdaceae bacterium]